MKLLRANSRFRLLWIVNLVSSMVGWSLGIALAVHIFLFTESALLTSVLAATGTVAGIAFGAVAGAVADRFDRLRIVRSALLARAALLVGLFGVAESVPGLIAVVFLQATVQQFYGPAEQVLIASYVPGRDLPEANGLNSLASNATRLVAPALGGFVIAWAGFRWTVLGMSVLMAVSFLLSVLLPRDGGGRDPDGGADEPAGHGFRTIMRTNARARGLVLLQLLDAVKEGPLSALFPVLMLGVIGASSGEMGLANSSFAVTAIIAGPIVGLTIRRLGYRLPVVLGAAIANALIVVLVLWPSTPMALITFCLSGLPFTISWVGTQTWLLLSVPDSVRGRVVGTSGAVYSAVLLTTMLGAGALADIIGVRWVLGVTAAVSVIGLFAVDKLVRTPSETPVPR
ncbi:MFS transporter [Actinosynnema sp. NPDC047251]|uniref:Permease, MFS-type n=1 Tax=Saccharothrix espanaensis (strain ATCC 51144 / DSM 44229 / JCM 9112 / NBRC 15066 / NRRL 15764) TaxID=1179773 RepID=K0JUF3_SACES|nr:MFS transporter [Saccharothrix espanaensis]CCH29556.1 Permease, MFS-type [Saccharothrix espanaensis DSM 44229]